MDQDGAAAASPPPCRYACDDGVGVGVGDRTTTGPSMTKSELIELIAAKQKHLPAKDVELAVKQVLEIMSDALAQGERIEIRGFGSFSLHFRPPRQGRNPKTGETVALSGKYVPHFKPGKDLRERVNEGAGTPIRD